MSTGRHYQGVAGERYFDYQQHGGRDRANVVARSFREHVRRDDCLLDFGCGTGLVLDAMDAREKAGLEVNPPAIELARSLGHEIVGSLGEFADERFDVVISNHALEHTLCPLSELQGLHRVLKPTGRLVMNLPINDWRNERDPGMSDPNHHLYTWTPLLIRNLLAEAGFETQSAAVVNAGYAGRFTGPLGRRLPERAFDVVSAFTAVTRRRRELRVVARLGPGAAHSPRLADA